MTDRRTFRIPAIVLLAAGLALVEAPAAASGLHAAGSGTAAQAQAQDTDAAPRERAPLTKRTLREAANIFGLQFTDEELTLMLEGDAPFADVNQLRDAYAVLRDAEIGNDVPPALYFRPWAPAVSPPDRAPRWSDPGEVGRPDDLEQVAFWPLPELAELVRTGQVSSVELTRMFLDRLRRHDPVLHAVVTVTEERALERARRADREIAAGDYRGPLHGIPYGAKDLLALPGHPTTWGAMPYREQVVDETATVIERLDEAGAVLVAKMTLGALAWGDVWFGGRTRNPWNPEEGSSGSSAGSAAAVSAGLVPFAIGTETLGSIVSPSTRTGVTGLRPSFGRVSRHGAMVVSWSMDKIGPICRHVEDCAIVFDAIRGPDGEDPTVVDAPFPYRPGVDLSELRIGYLASAFEDEEEEEGVVDQLQRQAGDEEAPEQEAPEDEDAGEDEAEERERARQLAADRRVLEVLRELGAELVPIELPDRPIEAMGFILSAEAATAHDSLTRTGLDTLLVRQQAAAWPNVFRSSRFIPAVEYLQANQLRTVVGREMRDLMADVDVYVAPSFRGGNLLLTNLTGHPAVVVPSGFTDADSPVSITFTGRMNGEAAALAVAKAYQDATEWDERHPERFVP